VKEMKTLTLNGKTYDSFHDADARERLDELEQNGAVKTVNGIAPDENGNVEVQGGGPGGGIVQETDPTVPAWAKQPNKPTYTASEVGARPATWMPTAQEVGALPNTYTPPNQTAEQVGADPKGTAANAVSEHNTADSSHGDIRLLITGLTNRLNALANSTDTDLDQMAELVAYIKSNKSLIDGITTSKVSVSDIVNNLSTNASTKPLSAAQGVTLKALIDAITVPTKLSQLTNDKGYITDYTESDPTVPAWAKQPTKPTYTAAEVGAEKSGTASSAINTHNTSSEAHNDIREEVSRLSSGKADKAYVNNLLEMVGTLNTIEAGDTVTEQYIPTTLTEGYVAASGTAVDGYADGLGYTERISVAAGQTIKVSFALSSNGKRQYAPLKYVAAYEGGSSKATSSLGVNKPSTDVYEYIVPEGVTEIIVTSRFFYAYNGVSYIDGIVEKITTLDEEQVSFALDHEIVTDIVYEYAQEGGFKGTKEELAESLANGGTATAGVETKQVVVNYFDKTKLKEGKSINTNGSLVSVSGTYASTEVIPFPEISVGDTFVFVSKGRTIDKDADGVKIVFYDASNAIIGTKMGISGYGCPAFYMDDSRASTIKGYALEFAVSASGAAAYDYTYIHDVVDNLMLIRLNDGVSIFNDYVPYLETATIPLKYFSTDKRDKYDGKFMCGAYSDGYGGYPSNNAASYEIAARLDFDVIKGDVRITSDGVLVMCHDPAYTLTNGKISGVYSTADFVIREHTFAEVRALEFAAKPVHPSTMEELLVICKKYGKIPLLTIRDEYIDEVIPKTFELLEKYDMVSSAILNSVTWNTIVELRRYNADIMLSHPQRCQTSGNPSVLELCAMVMLMDSLGNCIYNCYCSLGSNTSEAEFVGSLDKAMPAIELAKSRDLRVWAAMTTASQTEELIARGIVGTFGWNTYTETNKKEVVSADVSNGVISFKNILGAEQFKVTLPVYNGGVS
jgi:hypothetical protein